ncbi:MAG: urease accessory protein UreE [Pseudomonadota bacterium]
MLKATAVAPAGTWPLAEARDKITLGFDDRHRRRIRLVADGGLGFLLDLPEAVALRDGDGLVLDGGGVVAVRAAAEELLEITASPGALTRLAWHLGNRHLPVEIGAGRLVIRDDHVIGNLLRGLGATLKPVRAPFNPEGGAYGQHNHDPRHPHPHRDHG